MKRNIHYQNWKNIYLPTSRYKVSHARISSGFMLIELIVATLIATMISVVLLTALDQGSRLQVSVDNIISLSERIAIASHQLEKDLAGAFIPIQSEDKKATESKDGTNQAPAQPDTKTTQQTSHETEDKKEQKPIEKIFYGTTKDEMLDTLTFITNNPLEVFVGKDVGTVKPKIMRVQYTLRTTQDKKDSYSLFRQEGPELDLAHYKNVRAYEVISGIKSCTVTYTARIEKKEDQKQSQNQQKESKISYDYKKSSEWTSEPKKQSQSSDSQESKVPRIPYSIEFKFILWDEQDKKDKEYTIVCAIPDIKAINKQDTPKKQQAPHKKDDQKTEKSGDSNKENPQQVFQQTHIISQETVVLNESDISTIIR